MDQEIDDLLEDLSIKYLLNLPEEEYNDLVQLCYAFQLAHWEYTDAPETQQLHHKLSLHNFVMEIIDRTPMLGLNKADVPRIIAMFNNMNWQIPVYGAILINQTCDKVLLVQTLVSNAKGGAWMFPRGKMEKRDHGTSFDCACREVFEETGFQMRGVAKDDDAHYVERRIQGRDETKVVGLYMVPGVDEQYAFCSQTQGEIFQFAWFRIQDLMNQMKKGEQIMVGPQVAKFVHVNPFLTRLQEFVSRLKRQQRAGSAGVPQAAAGQGHAGTQQMYGGAPQQWGFDEMMQHNRGLRGGADGMRPYEGVLTQKQQQQTAKQRRKAAAGFEQEQAQAVQLALEATKAASQARSKLASDSDVPPLLDEDSGSLNARRDGRKRTRRRSRAGSQAHPADGNAGAVVGVRGAAVEKDKGKKGGVEKKEGGGGVRGRSVVMGTLQEHWEPAQMTLPEIKWRGLQPFGSTVTIGQAVGTRRAVQGSRKHWSDFSLQRAPVMDVLNAALSHLA